MQHFDKRYSAHEYCHLGDNKSSMEMLQRCVGKKLPREGTLGF